MDKKDTITPIDQHVIDYVMALRNKHELTQEDIANIIGLSRSFIKDVESPKRIAKYNLAHINALADYFNISPREFLPKKAIIEKVITSESLKTSSRKKKN